MRVSPDEVLVLSMGPLTLNATILFTWAIMVLMVAGSWLLTRGLRPEGRISRRQHVLEAVVSTILDQVDALSRGRGLRLLPFLATLFLFVAASNVLSVVPGFLPPTGSLSTTTALALCVFTAVPIYGISEAGFVPYLRSYLQPTFLMLPFNVMGEITRTVALAVRLFGNVMSGTMIAAILLMIAPLVFPVLIQLLGLLTGLVQAYIFAVLAAVYLSAGMEVQGKPSNG
jgi:F-type H+-transporting ATPase subunit a